MHDLLSLRLFRPPCTCSAAADICYSAYTTSSDDSTANATSLHTSPSLQSHPSIPSLQLLIISPTNTTSPAAAAGATHQLLTSFRLHRSPISALALSASNHLYTASAGDVRVWDVHTLSEVDAFNLSGDGAVKFLAFASDGSGAVFTAHQDRRIRIWRPESKDLSAGGRDRRRHRLVATLPTLRDRLVRGVVPRNYVRVRRHRKRLWVEHSDAVSGVAAAGGFVYSVSWDRTLKIWRRSDLRCVESVAAHDDAVNAVAVAGDGTVYTGSADGRIRAWRKQVGGKRHDLLATLERHRSGVNALALEGGGEVLYSGAGDRSVLVWEREESAEHMAVAGALRGHRGAVLSLAVVAGGEEAVVVSGSADRTVRVWRRRPAEEEGGRMYDCLAVLVGHGRAVRTVVASATAAVPAAATAREYTVCSGCLDGEVRVWRVQISSSSSSSSSLLSAKHLIKDSDDNHAD